MGQKSHMQINLKKFKLVMAKSLAEGFDTFISWLAPLGTEHNLARSHRNSVESCLKNNFGCYKFFETGSFGNGTGVRHYSDTDYFAICPNKELWENSATTLRKVKESLQSTFWNTVGIEVRTPAVKIPFGQYISETLEVTPCTFNGLVNTPVGSRAYYSIADTDGAWMLSSPEAHVSYVDKENIRLKGKLKPLIQLVKAWKFYHNVPINSFYLELRVTKYAEGEKSIVYDIDIKRIICNLDNIGLASIQDPMGISGLVKACISETKKTEAISKLSTARSRAEKACVYRESNLDNSFYWWNMFYNDNFPKR